MNRELDEDKAKNADPTGKYYRWIMDSYKNGGIREEEDLGRVYDALEKYEILKKKNMLQKVDQYHNEKDINTFCGIIGCTKKGFEKPGLEDLIDKYKDVFKQEKVITSKDAIEIYNDDQIRIIQPLTLKGSCYYGQSTRWCTAARNGNVFDQYNSAGPLYIIIPHHPSYQDEKYQLSFAEKQFMNEHDDPVNLDYLISQYPSLVLGLPNYLSDVIDVHDTASLLWNIERSLSDNNIDMMQEILNATSISKIKPFYIYINSVEMLQLIQRYDPDVIKDPLLGAESIDVKRQLFDYMSSDIEIPRILIAYDLKTFQKYYKGVPSINFILTDLCETVGSLSDSGDNVELIKYILDHYQVHPNIRITITRLSHNFLRKDHQKLVYTLQLLIQHHILTVENTFSELLTSHYDPEFVQFMIESCDFPAYDLSTFKFS